MSLLVIIVLFSGCISHQRTNITNQQGAATASEATAAPSLDENNLDPDYPRKLVVRLQRPFQFSRYECYLVPDPHSDWQQSRVDGMWFANLRRAFGPNEVSCLLESSTETKIERVELQAEFYEPGVAEGAVIAQFLVSAQILMYPHKPDSSFSSAVLTKTSWGDEKWVLKRESHPPAGFDLTLRKRSD